MEKEKVRAALRICEYPEWALKDGELRRKRQLRKEAEKQKDVDQIEDRKSSNTQFCHTLRGDKEVTKSF